MQVIEILLSNSPESVYAEFTDRYQVKDRVIISENGSEDIGVIKGAVEVSSTPEFVDILRTATSDDMRTNCENCKYARSLLSEIKRDAENAGLNMKIGFISTNLNRTKLTIHYTADSRIDFREIVKTLGAKYKTRIEMHQIGNRDETKQIGALGVCGRETCCKAFLNDFDKVSIKMAKNQEISLNPNRINGMCGRLLCCLKYEDDYYEDLQKRMPKLHSTINTPDGRGEVTFRDILHESVTVTFTKDDTTETKVYTLEELEKNKK